MPCRQGHLESPGSSSRLQEPSPSRLLRSTDFLHLLFQVTGQLAPAWHSSKPACTFWGQKAVEGHWAPQAQAGLEPGEGPKWSAVWKSSQGGRGANECPTTPSPGSSPSPRRPRSRADPHSHTAGQGRILQVALELGRGEGPACGSACAGGACQGCSSLPGVAVCRLGATGARGPGRVGMQP